MFRCSSDKEKFAAKKIFQNLHLKNRHELPHILIPKKKRRIIIKKKNQNS